MENDRSLTDAKFISVNLYEIFVGNDIMVILSSLGYFLFNIVIFAEISIYIARVCLCVCV